MPAPPEPRPDKGVTIPPALKDGLGLICKREIKEPEIFLLSKTKRKYGAFFYHNDTVTISEYDTRLWPEIIEMGSYHLKRQTLELTFQGQRIIGKCEVVNPEDVVNISIKNLADKLSKNKI